MLAMIWHEIVCWFLKIYQDLKRFAAQEHRIVFILTFRCAKQFYVPNMQEQSKAGKKSEINRQTFVIWWLNSRRYRSVWYLFSCARLKVSRDIIHKLSEKLSRSQTKLLIENWVFLPCQTFKVLKLGSSLQLRPHAYQKKSRFARHTCGRKLCT